MTDGKPGPVTVRNTRPEDFPGIIELTKKVYPFSPPWRERHLSSHRDHFPEGQFVVEARESGRIVGMAASLIVQWDDYDITDNYWDFTDGGLFSNHDPEHGRTLYGAEIMVDPDVQGRGIGKKIYAARRELVERLGLRRIRAGARLRNYSKFADRMSAEDYTIRVIRGEIGDPTLTFQLKQGFHVLAIVPNYWKSDPESLGFAALIEWINHKTAKPADYAGRDKRFDVTGS